MISVEEDDLRVAIADQNPIGQALGIDFGLEVDAIPMLGQTVEGEIQIGPPLVADCISTVVRNGAGCIG
jgi:hypothetical protein